MAAITDETVCKMGDWVAFLNAVVTSQGQVNINRVLERRPAPTRNADR